MQVFQKILFVSELVTDDVDALEQALCIAYHGGATLSALIVYPQLPNELTRYKKDFDISLVQKLTALLHTARMSYLDDTYDSGNGTLVHLLSANTA
jgi:hypothetical protein